MTETTLQEATIEDLTRELVLSLISDRVSQPWGFSCAYAAIRAVDGVIHRDDIRALRELVRLAAMDHEEHLLTVAEAQQLTMF
jgi:hypothetical protein